VPESTPRSCFGPSSATIRHLQNNISISSLDNVFLRPVALADTDTQDVPGSGGPGQLRLPPPQLLLARRAYRGGAGQGCRQVSPRAQSASPCIDLEGPEKKVLSGPKKPPVPRPTLDPDGAHRRARLQGRLSLRGGLRQHVYPGRTLDVPGRARTWTIASDQVRLEL
jgi:hypothetical protein